MRRQQIALLLAVVPALLTGCRKDGATEAPTITNTAPGTAYTAVVPDTVAVVAEVSDNERVESVTFSIVNGQGQPVSTSLTVTPSSNPATISVHLPLTSDLILSGDHEIKVVASDGDNRGTASRIITVMGLPRRVRAIHLVTRPSPSQVEIHRIDSAGVLQPLTTLGQDMNVSAITSRGQRLIIGGGATGPMVALDPDLGGTTAQLANTNILTSPFFTALDLGLNGLFFVATNDGVLRRLDKGLNGTGYQAAALPGHLITHTLEVDGRVITSQDEITSSAMRIVHYSPVGGVETDVQALDKVPVALQQRDADHILLFGNRNGEGVIEDRNILDGGYWEPRVFNDPIQAVAAIDANIQALSVGGDLVRFTYSNASVLTLATGINAEQLAYNEVSGELIASAGSQVMIMDPGNGAIITTYTLPAPVVRILPLYNR